MHPHTRKEIRKWYNLGMDHALAVLLVVAALCAVGAVIFWFAYSFGLVGWMMLRMILPAVVARGALKWPDSVATRDVWRGLVLIGLVTSQSFQSPVLSCVLAGCAFLVYKDKKAATEWMFLGCLAWGFPVLAAQLEPLAASFMSPGLVRSIVQFALYLLFVGEGWWKLVTIYAFARSYGALWESGDAGVDASCNKTETTVLNEDFLRQNDLSEPLLTSVGSPDDSSDDLECELEEAIGQEETASPVGQEETASAVGRLYRSTW